MKRLTIVSVLFVLALTVALSGAVCALSPEFVARFMSADARRIRVVKAFEGGRGGGPPSADSQSWRVQCEWGLNEAGRVRVVILYYLPNPEEQQAYASEVELRTSSRRPGGLVIDGESRVLGRGTEVWFVSDTVKASRVPLNGAERRELLAGLSEGSSWEPDELRSYIERTVLPYFRHNGD